MSLLEQAKEALARINKEKTESLSILSPPRKGSDPTCEESLSPSPPAVPDAVPAIHAPEVRKNEESPPPPSRPVAVAEQLRALWVPQPCLSRHIPDHAATLYAYLQDHAGEFLTVDALFARRGGPREDLEASLTLLVRGGLVAVLEASDPLRYGAREPRVLEVVLGPPSPRPARPPRRRGSQP